jgi:hypothetical protein
VTSLSDDEIAMGRSVMRTGRSGPAKQLGSAHLLIVSLLLVGSVSNASSSSISIGPAINGGTLWLDPTRPNTNSPPTFVQQGMVVTIPTYVSVLSTASFYVSPDTATYFKLQIYSWSNSVSFFSPTLDRYVYPSPTGSLLYDSGPVSFSLLNTNPTIFSIGVPVVAGNQYLFQLVGDGIVGVMIAQATPFATYYTNENFLGWHLPPPIRPPGTGSSEIALRSDIAFDSPSPVSLPPSVVLHLTGVGVLALLACRRKRKTLTARLLPTQR